MNFVCKSISRLILCRPGRAAVDFLSGKKNLFAQIAFRVCRFLLSRIHDLSYALVGKFRFDSLRRSKANFCSFSQRLMPAERQMRLQMLQTMQLRWIRPLRRKLSRNLHQQPQTSLLQRIHPLAQPNELWDIKNEGLPLSPLVPHSQFRNTPSPSTTISSTWLASTNNLLFRVPCLSMRYLITFLDVLCSFASVSKRFIAFAAIRSSPENVFGFVGRILRSAYTWQRRCSHLIIFVFLDSHSSICSHIVFGASNFVGKHQNSRLLSVDRFVTPLWIFWCY